MKWRGSFDYEILDVLTIFFIFYRLKTFLKVLIKNLSFNGDSMRMKQIIFLVNFEI